MNKVILIGRLTDEPQMRHTEGENAHTIASFTLAVDRKVVKQESKADFIRCMAWDKKAEVIEKYMHKGSKIAVSGRLQTGSYTNKDGATVYTTDVVVEELEFCDSKKGDAPAEPKPEQDWMAVTPDTELPFA